jgi:hypothetical protein
MTNLNDTMLRRWEDDTQRLRCEIERIKEVNNRVGGTSRLAAVATVERQAELAIIENKIKMAKAQ